MGSQAEVALYSCPYCRKGFSTKSYAQSHIAEKHTRQKNRGTSSKRFRQEPEPEDYSFLDETPH